MKTGPRPFFSKGDAAFFERLRKVAHGSTTNIDKERALRVFEAFLWGSMAKAELDPSKLDQLATSDWHVWVDETIKRDLDHRSLWEFVELVVGFYDGAKQSEISRGRHAENYALKAEIFRWLDKNKTSSMSLDAAAEMMAGKVVPLSFRTVRGHCTEWNKLRAAGRA